MDYLPHWSKIIFFALFIGFCLYTKYRRRVCKEDRLRLLAAWCHLNSLRFDPWRNDALRSRHLDFSCLWHGGDAHSINVMRGIWKGRYDFTGFDHCYLTGDDKSDDPTIFSAVILEIPLLLTPMRIRRAFWLWPFRRHFPLKHVELANVKKEFLRLYSVKSRTKAEALELLFPEAMRFLLEHPFRFTIQFDRHSVIAYSGKEFTPEEFGRAADLLGGLLDRLAPIQEPEDQY